MPQPPQSSGEVAVDTHDITPPAVQVVPEHEHMPPEQVLPAEQVVPQPPHAVGSVIGFTQRPPHMMLPGGQVHVPETHESPAGHARPHAPQLFTSAERSAHWPAVPKPPAHAT
jgi:hypothetical protein